MKYYAIQRSDTLAHHGVKGMKWGVKNGPPYPLGGVKKSSSYNKAKTIADSLSDEEKAHVFGSKNYENSKYSAYRKILSKNGEPSSFIEVFRDPDLKKNEGIAIVATNPKYRGQGDAKKLLGNLINNMPKGIDTLYWETDTSNKGSMRLAESFGFTRLKGNYKDDAIYMYKSKNRKPHDLRRYL